MTGKQDSDPQGLFRSRPDVYARYRPTYPTEIFEYLSGLAPAHERAWDCATGTGQCADRLVEDFEEVVATDVNAEQLGQATSHPRIDYRVAPAEESGLAAESVDLITVATALHWFDRPRFYEEARRVLVDGGILAAWSYGQSHLDPRDPHIREIMDTFNEETLEPYWSSRIELVKSGYDGIELPFEPLEWPDFEATLEVDLEGLLGYMRSWSASQSYYRDHGSDPVELVADEIAEAWGEPDQTRTLVWPLFGRVGRVCSNH